jgi:hypothetical protein
MPEAVEQQALAQYEELRSVSSISDEALIELG